jgi:hypothetical protein
MALPGHSVHLAFRTRALGLGWVLDGGLRPSELVDDRAGWQTVRVASFRPTLPGSRLRIDVHPTRSIGMRARFSKGHTPWRMSLFDHGYERARSFFEAQRGDADASDAVRRGAHSPASDSAQSIR